MAVVRVARTVLTRTDFSSGTVLVMESYVVGGEGGYGSQPVLSVTEAGPHVVFGRWGDYGTPSHLVNEWGPGVQAVSFDNGPPPGSPQMITMGLGPMGPVHDPTPENLLLLLDD